MNKSFTSDFVEQVFRERGVEPTFTSYLGAHQKLTFRCCCPERREGAVSWANLWYRTLPDGSPALPRCKECVKAGRQERGRSEAALLALKAGRDQKAYTLDTSRGLFRKHGAEPLFESYGTADEPLAFRCLGCGKERAIRLNSLIEKARNDPDHVVRCKSCVGLRVQAEKSDHADLTTEIHAYFRKHGAEPLFDAYPGKNSKPLPFRCAQPEHGTHTITWGQIKASGMTMVPRCPLCQLAARPRGETHKSYKPHMTDADREKSAYGRKHLFPVWQAAVMHLQGHLCAVTGQRGGALSAHHLRSWSGHPSDRFVISNGVTLSRDVHDDFHLGWMGGHHVEASEEGFLAFFKARTGREYVPLLRRTVPEVVFAFAPQPDLLVRKRECAALGLRYLPFFEPEVRCKLPIVNSMIRSREGLIVDKIGARSLRLVDLTHSQAEAFFQANHIQGHANAAHVLGLARDEEILSAMSFSPVRVRAKHHPDGTMELVRFANRINLQVQGAASRLLHGFLDRQRPPTIVTYADRRFCADKPEDTMYPALGFEYRHSSQASYSYTRDGILLLNKKQFQRRHLPTVLGDVFDPALTERENMERAGYARVEDCGTFVYEMQP